MSKKLQEKYIDWNIRLNKFDWYEVWYDGETDSYYTMDSNGVVELWNLDDYPEIPDQKDIKEQYKKSIVLRGLDNYLNLINP